jgi:protein-S-isoprenylcysteine O-methyltransferase Ste14
MPELALVLYSVYFVLAFAARVLIHRKRTGSAGIKGVSGRVGSLEWIGGVLFVVSIAAGVAAPILDLNDTVEPIEALDQTWLQWVGVGLFSFGLLATVAAQAAMGRSWRIGVEEGERTDLVTGGPFAIVRNPIYASMLPAFLGLTLLVPSVVALASFIALLTALEIQTRHVEEPYLRGVHGDRYGDYARRTGRFLPGVGRL